MPPILNAAIPLLAIFLATALVLAYDRALWFAGKRTISDDTRDLTKRYGAIVPIVIVGTWMGFVGLATGALVIHLFLYQY